MTPGSPQLTIRPVQPDEHERLGKLLVTAYAALPGMPQPDEQPAYYAMLADVAGRAARPSLTVFVATNPDGDLVGSIDFIADMSQYGSGGPASEISDAAGVRLLAVDGAFRGQGAGKALTVFCIERARALCKARVVLHTTRAMQTAWTMYEALGFVRFPELDFEQGRLAVFGFQLGLLPN